MELKASVFAGGYKQTAKHKDRHSIQVATPFKSGMLLKTCAPQQKMRCDGHVHTRCAQLRDIRDHDEGSGEVAAVSSLSHLHCLGPQHNLQGAWDGTAGELGLRLLDSHLNPQK